MPVVYEPSSAEHGKIIVTLTGTNDFQQALD